MSTTPRPRSTLRVHSYHLGPSAEFPRGLRLDLLVGTRRQVRRLAKLLGPEEGQLIQLGFGEVAAAVRVRPGS